MPEIASAAPAAPSTPSSTPSPAASTPAASSTPAAATSASPAAAKPAATAAPTASNLPHQEGADPANPHPEARPGETKAETVQRLKFKLKVNGKEEEREFSPEEAQLHIQKGLGAAEKFAEAAEVRKTFAKLQQALKENPFEALKDPAFGLDLEKLAIEHLAKKFEAEEMQKANPQQYRLEQAERRIAEYEARENALQEAQKQVAQAEVQKREIAEIRKSWNSALSKAGFGENEGFHRQLAEIGQEFLEAGLDLNPELLVAEFKNRLTQQNKQMFGGLKGGALANYLGDDVVNELLAYKVAQINQTRTQEPLPTAEPVKSAPGDDEKPLRTERYLSGYKDFLRST